MAAAGTYWAHETAIVDAGAAIGAGTRVWHWVQVSFLLSRSAPLFSTTLPLCGS